MEPEALGWLFALGAALSWAGLDALRKSLARDLEAVALVVLLTLGPAPLFLAWAMAEGAWFTSSHYLAAGAATLALNTVAYVAFMRAMRLSDLSTTVPMLALTPVLTAGLGALVLAEHPNAKEVAGIILVVVGAVALQARHTPGGGFTGWLTGVIRDPGARLMLVTATAWSGASTLDKVALRHASVPAHAMVQNAGMGLVLLLVLIASHRTKDLAAVRTRLGTYGAAVFLAVGAMGFQLLAYRLLFVAVVETVKRALGVVAALVLGHLLFAERVTWQKALSVAAIAVGTLLIL
jgi:drug/metabolite transporter (DMT)-like permease